MSAENSSGSSPPFKPEDGTRRTFASVEEALDYASQIELANKGFIRAQFSALLRGEKPPGKVRATYPYIAVHIPEIDEQANRDITDSWGYATKPGSYSSTVTRIDERRLKMAADLKMVVANHGCTIEVGVSIEPIAYTNAFAEDQSIGQGAEITPQLTAAMRRDFDQIEKGISLHPKTSDDVGAFAGHFALAPYGAKTIDFASARLAYYTGCKVGDFQDHVLFTNYGAYMEQFVATAAEILSVNSGFGQADSSYVYLSGPRGFKIISEKSGLVTEAGAAARQPQCPAYHRVRVDGKGETLINIGVGPSNAKTITDLLAVLRGDLWLMVGHAAGLRDTQRIGDMVLPAGYIRRDGLMDEVLPIEISPPPISEVGEALIKAHEIVTGRRSDRQTLRKGLVLTTANRHWFEDGFSNHSPEANRERRILEAGNTVALDMETGVIAANGFRHRVPYGAILCVSDRPLHGEHKLQGFVDHFFAATVASHLTIALQAIEIIRQENARLHSRTLRPTHATPLR